MNNGAGALEVDADAPPPAVSMGAEGTTDAAAAWPVLASCGASSVACSDAGESTETTTLALDGAEIAAPLLASVPEMPVESVSDPLPLPDSAKVQDTVADLPPSSWMAPGADEVLA